MKFTNFINNISLLESIELGGQTSQFKLVPQIRIKFSEEKIKNSNPRQASVLALFYPDEYQQTRFLLTQRASYNGTHSAQISFPGGKSEPNETLQQTALRETEEEVGVQNTHIKIIRKLSETYIPPSNFLVTPYIGFTNTKPIFTPNHEVSKIIEVLATDLIDDVNISSVEMQTSYMKNIEVPCFTLNSHVVWGATAMILSEIKDLLKEVQ
ncbi:CoA pyrophosphatase [Tenacibaculum sp. IB213877]|uniref:NUDIX hydrolase n=1 Tax=Tenacibaculum sp. IB213877 TaxID=3097351 RepID=UPI002A5AD6DC|nr:CoA pyrophosphatase [Tenacibaculum sp. IB213877]MDY0779273.1 CoA pyrophosphatase [Tenacibaculum sp. IB213877]